MMIVIELFGSWRYGQYHVRVHVPQLPDLPQILDDVFCQFLWVQTGLGQIVGSDVRDHHRGTGSFNVAQLTSEAPLKGDLVVSGRRCN